MQLLGELGTSKKNKQTKRCFGRWKQSIYFFQYNYQRKVSWKTMAAVVVVVVVE